MVTFRRVSFYYLAMTADRTSKAAEKQDDVESTQNPKVMAESIGACIEKCALPESLKDLLQ